MQKYKNMICPHCGALVFFEEGRTKVSCHACGLRITVGKEEDRYMENNSEFLQIRRSLPFMVMKYVQHLFETGSFAGAV